MKKLVLLIAALGVMTGLFASSASAVILNVEVGDQPYYVHGGGYWAHGVHYAWVPGHWAWHHHEKVWVHGHYRVA